MARRLEHDLSESRHQSGANHPKPESVHCLKNVTGILSQTRFREIHRYADLALDSSSRLHACTENVDSSDDQTLVFTALVSSIPDDLLTAEGLSMFPDSSASASHGRGRDCGWVIGSCARTL